jgi:Fe-S cluster biogenesis protein NfuA
VTLEARVQEALRTHAAPALGLDGSEIEVLEVSDGIATVRLGAICASCPGTLSAVVTGLEQELKDHVPEIALLEVVL